MCAILGGLLLLLGVPLGAVFGVVGIIVDRRKALAVVTATISLGFLSYYVLMIIN